LPRRSIVIAVFDLFKIVLLDKGYLHQVAVSFLDYRYESEKQASEQYSNEYIISYEDAWEQKMTELLKEEVEVHQEDQILVIKLADYVKFK